MLGNFHKNRVYFRKKFSVYASDSGSPPLSCGMQKAPDTLSPEEIPVIADFVAYQLIDDVHAQYLHRGSVVGEDASAAPAGSQTAVYIREDPGQRGVP